MANCHISLKRKCFRWLSFQNCIKNWGNLYHRGLIKGENFVIYIRMIWEQWNIFFSDVQLLFISGAQYVYLSTFRTLRGCFPLNKISFVGSIFAKCIALYLHLYPGVFGKLEITSYLKIRNLILSRFD